MYMDKESLKLYRKRIIPCETVLLKDDVILRLDDEMIITRWKALHPKPLFSHGASCYYLKRGYKVSRIYRPDNSLLHWYCDIVEYQWETGKDSLIVQDLLADVIITPDGKIQVLDLDELADSIENDLISMSQAASCLRNLNDLLKEIEQCGIERLDSPFANLIDDKHIP